MIVIILALLLAQALTNLYLPELNADIINNGAIRWFSVPAGHCHFDRHFKSLISYFCNLEIL